MATNLKTMVITIKAIFNVIKYVKSIINNLMILIKAFIYIINYLNLFSLGDIFNNIHKTLLVIDNIIKINIIVYTTAKFFYIIIIRLINRLRNG